MKTLISTLAVALPVLVIAWLFDIPRFLGVEIYTEQFLAGTMGIALPLIFLSVPARGSDGSGEGEVSRGRGDGESVPWYDIAAALVSAACCFYIAAVFQDYSQLIYSPPTSGGVVAIILSLLLIEGTRRTTGYGLLLVTLAIVVLALLGPMLPGTLQGRPIQPELMTYFLVWDASAIFGQTMSIVVTLVLAFVIFGNSLFRTGGATFFTDLAMALMGRFRGGSAKIAVVASSLFGTISGSVVANVVTTGSVTIPMMKRGGFKPDEAGAIEAVAGTGGQIMPPVMGIAAFLMAEFLQVPYADVVVAAIIPAALYYGAFFLTVDLIAAKKGIRAIEKSRIPPLLPTLRDGWHLLFPFVVLVVALFNWNMQPEQAAMISTAVILLSGLVFGFRGHRISLKDCYLILRDTGHSVLELFMIGAAAGVVIAALSYSGLGFGLSLSLVHLAGGNVVALLLLAAVASIILGMGMPTPGVYILLATLVAPSLVELGIKPMAAHMFIMYFGCLSMITPPVAIGAFAAANIAGSGAMKTAWTACKMAWTAFIIPFAFVFSDTLLLSGPIFDIVIDVAAATFGVGLATVGIVGYALAPVGIGTRVLAFVSGLFLIAPLSLFSYAPELNALGAIVGIAILGREVAIRRRSLLTAQPTPAASEKA